MSLLNISKAEKPLNRRKIDWAPYNFLLPSLILIAMINLYPLIVGVMYSLQDGTLIQPGDFAGIQNYIDLFRMSEFYNSLYFSTVFAFFAVIGSYLAGLGLAVLINKDVWLKGFFRVALLVPWIIPSIVSIVGWRWLIADENALLNQMITFFGFSSINFLGTESGAIFSVILIKIWRSFPFMMVSILAALQTISNDLYEAATIDGANRWKSFLHITWPSIKGISVVCWILMTIWSFNDFDTIWLLTQGGPINATENLIVLAYNYTFIKSELGIGSSIAIVSLIILMGLAYLMLRFQEED
ncbi:carbohydrate ABC transporter permease [Gracilibacillus thailandensis]|uniref:ABC transporter permease subunit n=1 Tax=Gracilibacillus thailandensis TaxID=563735 RepID=A0A6N7R183_9BACI|nr:sugar ABC transporter permease [Gracilibacillus thailandensis]MRI67664.1 ABC transporter permease subunit [Gracilibacillus thailandensis]